MRLRHLLRVGLILVLLALAGYLLVQKSLGAVILDTAHAQAYALTVDTLNADFHTEFEAAGINQTRHKIYLQLHADVRLVLPTGARPIGVDTQVLIAESIIVGQVPGSYINVPEGEMLNFGQ